MRARSLPLALALAGLLAPTVGCSADPERMTYWAREVIHVEEADEATVDQVLARARSRLQAADPQGFAAPVVAGAAGEAGPESVDVDVKLTDSLFGEKWLPRYDDGLGEGRRVRARMSVAVARTPSERVGHLQAETVLAGLHDPEVDMQTVGAQAVQAAVSRLTAMILEAAEEAGLRAQVTAREKRP